MKEGAKFVQEYNKPAQTYNLHLQPTTLVYQTQEIKSRMKTCRS